MISLEDVLHGTRYVAYAYSYPHKTAYRVLKPPIPLEAVWAAEQKAALFLYIHVPFCEMRCGFCNLFTTTNAGESLENAYLDSLEQQAKRVRVALGDAPFARMAVGGGTPTYLDIGGLSRLFDIAEHLYGVDLMCAPISVETSPQTAETAKLRLLRERGVDRISIGVQSFLEHEVRAVGRSQRTAEVHRALDSIRQVGFPTLNIDLIYGLPHQTVESWLESLKMALAYQPEEIYLYPLYQRPLTGLDGLGQSWEDQRLACYRAGRELLLSAGYAQISMRMFRALHAPAQDGPVYCCQEDGMVGLGCGARSYTRGLHYSTEYAVGYRGVRAILNDYVRRSDASFDYAHYGCPLSDEEQRRRYVIKSLLRAEGLSLSRYAGHFNSAVLDDFPELECLKAYGLAVLECDHMRLTSVGYERSDVIGPWLYSTKTRDLMEAYELR